MTPTRKKYWEKYKAENADKIREYHNRYYLAHRDRYREGNARRHLWRKYKLTPTELREMLKEQNGACAICRVPFRRARGYHPCVDHNHNTGKVRGLLCWCCNVCLGMLERSGVSPDKFKKYLRKGL